MKSHKLAWTILVSAILILLLIYLAVTSKHGVNTSAWASGGSQGTAGDHSLHVPHTHTSTTAEPAAALHMPAQLYVDCVHGRDGNPGTQTAPYRSLAKLDGRYLRAGAI